MAARRSAQSIRRAIGFALIPIAGIASPLLALPAISSGYGATGWAAVAVGQSLGAGGAVLVELGWALSGPQRVARMGKTAAYRVLRLSLATKLIVFPPVAALAMLVATLVAPSYSQVSAVVALGAVAMGFSATWFLIGRRQPWAVVATDGAVRVVCVCIAALAIMGGGPLILYPVVGLIIPSILAPLLAVGVAARGTSGRSPRWSLRRLLGVVRSQSKAVGARGVSALYIALPITLVTLVAPQATAAFAAGERLLRTALSGLSPWSNALLGWVGSASVRAERLSRATLSIWLCLGFGLVAAAGFGALLPWVAEFVFAGEVPVDGFLPWAFALTLLIVLVSRATGSITLVALGRIDVILASAIAGAVVGVPSILGGAATAGALGGALGEAIAEFCVLTVQAVMIFRIFGTMRKEGARDGL